MDYRSVSRVLPFPDSLLVVVLHVVSLAKLPLIGLSSLDIVGTFQIKTSRVQPVGSAYSTLTGNPATSGGGVAK